MGRRDPDPGDAENELLERARAGDEAALSELLRRVEPAVYRFGLKLCGHPEDARGVLQETLLSLVRSVEDFRGDAALSTWLYTVARNHCIKKRRRGRFAPAALESLDTDGGVAELASDEPDAAEALERRRLAASLDQAIRALDEGQREVLVLRDVEGLTAPEVAAVLGLSVAAVKSRLHRARAALRSRLAEVVGAPAATPAAAGEACPDVVEVLSRKLEDEVTAEVCAEMERHVEGCPRCRALCGSLRRTLAVCSASPLPVVPAKVQAQVRERVRAELERLRARPK